MDVAAISDGNVVIVNQPVVKDLADTDTSFCTESSSVTDGGEETEIEAGSFVPTGPLSGFRRRRAERIASRRQEKQQAEEERKKMEEAIPERMFESDFASLRARRISATVVKSESNSYGIGLVQVPRKKNLVKIDALVNEGLLCNSPFREGDILKTVNNEVVEGYRSVMLRLMKAEGPVTLSIETPAPQSNPAVVQAFCRKPSPDTQLGIEFEIVERSTTNGTEEITTSRLLQIRSIEPDGFLAYSALSPGDFVLSINGAPCTEVCPEEAASMIVESESIVSIVALNPELAQPTRVQRWMRAARRTGVGAVGGTMLGLGLIMIPLPFPPPMGEMMVVGGVSVLGTEFEAPKRVMRNARDALQNAVESNDNEEVEIDKLQQMESVGDHDGTDETKTECDSDGETTSEARKSVVLRDSFLTVMSQQNLDEGNHGPNGTSFDAPTTSDCWSDSNLDTNIDNMYSGKEENLSSSPSPRKQFFQNVGRNFVLPLLDRVVGDEKRDVVSEKLESKLADADGDPENR